MDKEQIRAWNDCFSFKIKDMDLKKPTEEFLTGALLSYLAELDYNITKIQSLLKHDSKEEQMIMKVRLCSIVNKFYKIPSDKNVFQYYDIINPSNKKIRHMLSNLLNYYLWISQTKSDILDKSEKMMNERDEAIRELRKLKQEHESIKARAKSVRSYHRLHRISSKKLCFSD